MTHANQNESVDHTAVRQWTIVLAFVVFVLGVVTAVAIGMAVNAERRYETNRADNALVALQQACDQVAQLGGRCVTEPSQVRGNAAPGIPGLPGRDGRDGIGIPGPIGPSGPAGPQGETGPASESSCPLVGYRLELLTVRLANGGDSRLALLCVKEP